MGYAPICLVERADDTFYLTQYISVLFVFSQRKPSEAKQVKPAQLRRRGILHMQGI